MKNRIFTIAAVALHLILASVLYAAATNPKDHYLTQVNYPKQGVSIALYAGSAEILYEGRTHVLECSPYRNDLGEWEAVEGPTGDFLIIGQSGTTTARIGGKYLTFLPE